MEMGDMGWFWLGAPSLEETSPPNILFKTESTCLGLVGLLEDFCSFIKSINDLVSLVNGLLEVVGSLTGVRCISVKGELVSMLVGVGAFVVGLGDFFLAVPMNRWVKDVPLFVVPLFALPPNIFMTFCSVAVGDGILGRVGYGRRSTLGFTASMSGKSPRLVIFSFLW